MMPRIYYYKMTTDNGGAPCVEDDLLSLAICKPMMRRTAQKGDILIGFAANSLHSDNRLIYVARVAERLADGQYFRAKRYMGRPDCIYKWGDDKFIPKKGALYHGTREQMKRDIGKKCDGYPRAIVLLAKDFCYYGEQGKDSYKDKFPRVKRAVESLGVGHRVNHIKPLHDQLTKLIRIFGKLDGPHILGDSTSGPTRGLDCGRRGCGPKARRMKRRPKRSC